MSIGPASVIVPTFNEERHIEGVVSSLLQEPSSVVGEVLVADGRSTDRTREIVARLAASDPRVRLIDNPDRLQSAGVNRAVAEGDPQFGSIVRVDAHSHYPRGYAAAVLEAMATSGSDSVVVRLRSVGTGCMQSAVAAVSNSKLGTGGSAHRVGGYSGFVDHGHHAGFRRAAFDRAGGYDETFEANEDAELDYRIRASGGRIWMAGNIEVDYFPRSSFRRLFVQYWRYGSGRARTWRKHRERLRFRQMLPPIATTAALLGALASLIWLPMLILPMGYIAVLIAGSIGIVARMRSPCALLAVPILLTMHCAWSWGFLRRLASH